MAHKPFQLLAAVVFAAAVVCDAQKANDINHGPTANRPVGRPYMDWALECGRRRSLGGINTRQYQSDKHGVDVLISGFCRDIPHVGDPILRINEKDCYTTDPVNLKTGNVTYKDKRKNCKEGDFISSIYSDFNGGNRELTLRCCKPFNAKIDQHIGCNEEGPIDLFRDFHGFLKDPYDPRDSCPRDALVQIHYQGGKLKFKFCAFRIDARKYLATCPDSKTGAIDKKGDGQSTSLDNLYRLEQDKWSGVQQSWTFECKGFKVINHIAIGFAYHVDEVRRDVLFKMKCGPLIEQRTEAQRIRVTAWTKISWLETNIDDYGCRDHEALIGIASNYNTKDDTRYVLLICAEFCNADKVGDSDIDVPTLLRWGQVKEAIPDLGDSFHNIAMEFKGTKSVSLVSVFAQYKAAPKVKCTTTSRVDENTGITIDNWTPELDVYVKSSDLARVKQNVWSSSGESWRMECATDEVIQKHYVKDDGKGDQNWKILCTKQVQRAQLAHVVRYTKWMGATGGSGCRDNEAVKGIMSYYHAENKARYLSLICVEGSNANVRGDTVDVMRIVESAETEFAAQNKVAMDIGTSEVNAKDQVNSVFGRFVYVSDAKFQESMLIDEIEGVTSTTLDVNVSELDPVAPNDWSFTRASWKIECPGFDGVYTVWGRNQILNDGSDDIEMKFNCKSVLPDGKTNKAVRNRWTGWSNLHRMKIKLGCRNEEVLQGVASYWDTLSKTRFFAFLCTEGSNTAVSEGARVLSFVVEEGSYNGTVFKGEQSPGREELFQNVLASGFNYRKVETTFNGYLIRYMYQDKAKFEESSMLNEGTGEVLEVVVPPPGASGTVVKTTKPVNGTDKVAKGCHLDACDPQTTDDRGLPVPSLSEKEWSQSGVDFSFRCSQGHSAVHSVEQRVLPWQGKPDQYDISFKFKCSRCVVDGSNIAYVYRVTKWKFIRDFNDKAGCRDAELMAGLNSFIDRKSDRRFISLVCIKLSNGKKAEIISSRAYPLSRAGLVAYDPEKFIQNNFYSFSSASGSLSSEFTFVDYQFKATHDFSYCELTDDNTGAKIAIEKCGGEPVTPPPPTLPPGIQGEGFCALEKLCPSGWRVRSDCPKLYGCYKVFNLQLEWKDAAEFCSVNHGAQLAKFDTHSKWEFAKEFVVKEGKRFWLGLHRPSDGPLQWADGETADLKHWMPYPTNGRGRTCVIHRNHDWLDNSCTSKWNEGFICEIF